MQQGLAHVASDLERNPLGQRTWSQPLPSGQTSFGYTNSIAGELLAHSCVFWARGNAFLDLFLERKYWIIFWQPKSGFLKYIFIYLIWPNPVLLAAHGILDRHCSLRTLSCGTCDLVPWPGIQPRPAALIAWSLSRWTRMEVPWVGIVIGLYLLVEGGYLLCTLLGFEAVWSWETPGCPLAVRTWEEIHWGRPFLPVEHQVETTPCLPAHERSTFISK